MEEEGRRETGEGLYVHTCWAGEGLASLQGQELRGILFAVFQSPLSRELS